MTGITSVSKKSILNVGLQWIENFLVFLTGCALIALTFFIFVDVALRFLFNSPLPAGAAIAEILMPYIGFCALSYTLFVGQHVRITILYTIFPHREDVLEVVNSLIGAVFCGLITWGSWKFFWKSFLIKEEMLAVIKLPWYVGKFSMPLGFFFFTVRYVLQAQACARSLMKKS